jgi:signal transduction histidine kinase
MSLIQQRTLRLRLSRVDVGELVRRAVAAAAAETTHHQITARLPSRPLTALVDSERLAQVVTLLVDNAVRFSPDGRPIEVELSPVPATGVPEPADSAAAAHAARPEMGREMMRLTVRDHGMGIPPAHRARVFDRYHQAHQGGYLSGIGVGLYVCRGIVELHDGQIEAQFPEDGGTRFVVTIPIANPQEWNLPTPHQNAHD